MTVTADGYPNDPSPDAFIAWLGALDAPDVIEVGTRRSERSNPTHHRVWAPPSATYVMSDAFDGDDVDVVADAENMDPFDDESFDALICCSTLEHIPRPWKALEAFARILRPGGMAYLATHQTFPIHGYPSDYFRFSTQAMQLLGVDVGLEVVSVGYIFPCTITPPAEVTRWNRAAESWLNVSATYRKPTGVLPGPS